MSVQLQAQHLIHTIETKSTYATGHFNLHQTTTLMRAAAVKGIELGQHDMPAEMYNELAELLLAYSRHDTEALFALNRLRERYGASTRKKLGLD